MKIELGRVINSQQTIQEIYQQMTEKKVKAKLAWRFMSIVKEMEEPNKRFNDLRNDLIKKYGKETEDRGFSIEPNTEEFSKFIEELNDLASEEIELNIKKISIDDIEDIEIEIDKLMSIQWIIEE